jgi:hypothetical protein
MAARVSVIEVSAASAATATTELPLAISASWGTAFQIGAFQPGAFQMSPVAPSSGDEVYPAAVTIIEIIPG